MKFLGKLLIVILLFFIQIGFLCIAQSDSAPIGLVLLVTFLYGFLCDDYFLGFINGILSWTSFFVAVGLWSYVIQGLPIWDVLRPVFTDSEFYVLALLFGMFGIIFVTLGRWLKQREASRKCEL